MKNPLIYVLPFLWVFISCSGSPDGRISATGIVEGDVLSIKSKINATVSVINLEEGKLYREGDLLIKFDQRKIKNRLSALEIREKLVQMKIEGLQSQKMYALASKAYTETQRRRYRRLVKTQSLAEDKLEKTDLKLKKIKSDIRTLDINLKSLHIEKEKLANEKAFLELQREDYTIKAPHSGVLIERFVNRGETVFPAKTVADLLIQSSIYIEIFLEGRECAQLKLGDSVSIKTDGSSGKDLRGKIVYFGRKAEFSPKYVISEKERQSLLYQVKIKLSNSKHKLKIGMPVTVYIPSPVNDHH